MISQRRIAGTSVHGARLGRAAGGEAGAELRNDMWLSRGGTGFATGADVGGSHHLLSTADGGTSWSLSPVPGL